MYVETILDVHRKYNALVLTAFNNDAGFVAALDKVSVSCYRSLSGKQKLIVEFCSLLFESSCHFALHL